MNLDSLVPSLFVYPKSDYCTAPSKNLAMLVQSVVDRRYTVSGLWSVHHLCIAVITQIRV